jgi:hypothetical protein
MRIGNPLDASVLVKRRGQTVMASAGQDHERQRGYDDSLVTDIYVPECSPVDLYFNVIEALLSVRIGTFSRIRTM